MFKNFRLPGLAFTFDMSLENYLTDKTLGYLSPIIIIPLVVITLHKDTIVWNLSPLSFILTKDS